MLRNETINNTKEWKEADRIALRISAIKGVLNAMVEGNVEKMQCPFFFALYNCAKKDRQTKRESERALIIQAQSI